jgi:hypothetical protein
MLKHVLVLFAFLISGFNIASSEKYFFANPPRYHYEKTFRFNPFLFFPCLSTICDDEYGCFRPFTFNLYLSLPPISGCPEIQRKKTVRVLAISKEEPEKFQSVGIIKKKSRVAVMVHGLTQEYDQVANLLPVLSLLRTHDYVVFVDRAYLAEPYIFDHIFIPNINLYPALVNNLLTGRITCKFLDLLVNKKRINPYKIKVVGFSGGAQTLSEISDYCREKYNLIFGHLVGEFFFLK